MNRAVPIDFSYVRSDSSGTSMPPEAADKAWSEKFCPIVAICLNAALAVRAGRRSKIDADCGGESASISRDSSHEKQKKLRVPGPKAEI